MATKTIVMGLVFLMTLFHVLPCSRSDCSGPMPGKCFSDENLENLNHTNTATSAVAAADCSFSIDQGLCQYTQGCRDQAVTNWTVANAGTARAEQSSAGTCGPAYSVLESPWLQIHYLSCLRFTYSRVNPAKLDVFVEYQDSSVHTVFSDLDSNHLTPVLKNIQPGIGKMIFRANGGGASTGSDAATVEISAISLDPGSCTFPDCDFEPHNNFCGWHNKDWTLKNYSFANSPVSWSVAMATFDVNTTRASLMTPLISTTEQNKTDCLEVCYGLIGQLPASLAVSVRVPEVNTCTAIWSNNKTTNSWGRTVFPLQVPAAYHIIFMATKPENTTVEILLDDVKMTRSSNVGDCHATPQNAFIPSGGGGACHIIYPLDSNEPTTETPSRRSTSASMPLSLASTTLPSASGPSPSPDVAASHTASSPPSSSRAQGENGVSTSPSTSNRKTDDNGKLSAIIGASVGAVVFVIIVVAVVVVIVYRRRHAKRSPNGNTTAAATVENRADGDMINLTSSTSPYELAGAPGKTRTAPRYANNHILTTRPTAPVLDDVDDGDYRRVSDAHSSVQTDVSAMYSQVQKKGKNAAGQPAGPGDAVYSQVNKKGKGINAAENQPDPGAVYSQVNKKGNNSAGHYDVPPAVNKKPGKPVIAPKPKQGKQPTSPTKNQVPGDTTGVDPYDTIDTVPSPGRPQPVSTEGAVETDDYNALDFDAVRRVKTETDEEEEAAGSYNFLYNDPSEGYSTAGEARKKVVIGSDYDHVQM